LGGDTDGDGVCDDDDNCPLDISNDTDSDGVCPSDGDCDDNDGNKFLGNPELCDNLDNDCDGSTDDNLDRPTTCGIGECGADGTETCTAGVWGGDTCTPGTPSAEVCDNLDNDCDGTVDSITRGTTCGLGECAGNTGEETCIAGAWGGDTCDPFAGALPEGPPGDQTCSDTVDNDCDGQTDLIDPDPECVVICTPTGIPETICNGIDDDCDTLIDEDFQQEATTCGVGECVATGQTTCVDGVGGNTCTPGFPSAELCDNLDNDCDGTVDGITRGTTCGVGECAGNTGAETCTAGTWGGDTCDPLAGAVPEVCDDGIDNDCDGEDGASPIIDLISIQPNTTPLGSSILMSTEFSDPNLDDTHIISCDWGNSEVSDMYPAVGSRAAEDSYGYTEPGVYTVTLTVSDGVCEGDSAIYQYAVIYDPEGGFVTGGGWINSPEGAYTANPSLTGKANFGFVSKYKKGASTPTGQTQFQFSVADLNFHSDTYDWLVIAGAKAQYKGVGTINGEGEYKFMLTGIDADINDSDSFETDRFRIKIWYEVDDTEHIVYDNSLGDDSDNATTEISGGSIVIHTGKGKK
jgi:hypothetical protein